MTGRKPDQWEADKLRKWKKALRLTDWKILLTVDMPPDCMAMECVHGCAIYTESIKTAEIQIIDPKYLQNDISTFMFEQTLIHELLHLKFCLLDDSGNDLQDRVLHQIIDDLAWAMIQPR